MSDAPVNVRTFGGERKVLRGKRVIGIIEMGNAETDGSRVWQFDDAGQVETFVVNVPAYQLLAIFELDDPDD